MCYLFVRIAFGSRCVFVVANIHRVFAILRSAAGARSTHLRKRRDGPQVCAEVKLRNGGGMNMRDGRQMWVRYQGKMYANHHHFPFLIRLLLLLCGILRGIFAARLAKSASMNAWPVPEEGMRVPSTRMGLRLPVYGAWQADPCVPHTANSYDGTIMETPSNNDDDDESTGVVPILVRSLACLLSFIARAVCVISAN